jgi:redox-sensing transcriptional repressor
MERKNQKTVSTVAIGDIMNLNPAVVKKDLSYVGSSDGKPKIGFEVTALIAGLEKFLGYNDATEAVLIGVGRLGRTLLSYEGFKNYGLNIVAAFDVDKSVAGTGIGNKKIFDMAELPRLVKRLNVHIGIITVPKQAAQEVCDILVDAGIKGIWNFAPAHLKTPDGIAVKNEDMAASLAELSNKLKGIV